MSAPIAGESKMDILKYAKQLVLEAEQTGEAVSDHDSTVVFFSNDGIYSVTDNGECEDTDNYDEAVRMVEQNLLANGVE